MEYETLGRKIQELVDLKHGSRETVGVYVTSSRSSIEKSTVDIETLWVGNDYASSGYLQAHSKLETFQYANIDPCKFKHDTGQYVKGNKVTVTHEV